VEQPAPGIPPAGTPQSAHPSDAGGAAECVARCRQSRGSVSSKSWRDCVVLHSTIIIIIIVIEAEKLIQLFGKRMFTTCLKSALGN